MKTMISEIYSGASESLTLELVIKERYKKFTVEDSTGKCICEITHDNLLVKHWSRDRNACSIVSEMVNPTVGTKIVFKRVQQFILRVTNNDEERKTYYTMEVCSYV